MSKQEEYRLLKEGEIILDGDIINTKHVGWISIKDKWFFGKEFNPNIMSSIKRRISSEAKNKPTGLTPRWVSEKKRLSEVKDAIARYFAAGVLIPIDWIEEYNELIGKNKQDTE